MLCLQTVSSDACTCLKLPAVLFLVTKTFLLYLILIIINLYLCFIAYYLNKHTF